MVKRDSKTALGNNYGRNVVGGREMSMSLIVRADMRLFSRNESKQFPLLPMEWGFQSTKKENIAHVSFASN